MLGPEVFKMASERQQQRNQRAQALGYRNEYDRRTWKAPQGEYFEQRAENAAAIHDLTFEEVYHDRNSEFWQKWRLAEREGVNVGERGASPVNRRYDSAYARWLEYDGYRDSRDRWDIGDTGEH